MSKYRDPEDDPEIEHGVGRLSTFPDVLFSSQPIQFQLVTSAMNRYGKAPAVLLHAPGVSH
eukprot:CAMPEP_0185775248 /NCGR_PEP_ID=MMETSP1174-20130828/81409_1 /TAXON_ID=35687 /ORGANISM="Dictyocha speculum, Strain CCMP1381" /LENGTH=60 /DNA_ID=CAMNT_0028462753 /DNA_START=332 /DNA_END=514 /DNA_ORIENTATION=-